MIDDRDAWADFTPAEVAFLREHQTAHLATMDARGRPHVVPVGYHFEPETSRFVVGGPHLPWTAKYRHVAAGRIDVALSIDDRPPPGRPRGISVHGHASVQPDGGRLIHPDFPSAAIWIEPSSARSWRINDDERVLPKRKRVGESTGTPR